MKTITYRKAMRNDINTMTDLLFLLYDGEGQAPGLSREELAKLYNDGSNIGYSICFGKTKETDKE